MSISFSLNRSSGHYDNASVAQNGDTNFAEPLIQREEPAAPQVPTGNVDKESAQAPQAARNANQGATTSSYNARQLQLPNGGEDANQNDASPEPEIRALHVDDSESEVSRQSRRSA